MHRLYRAANLPEAYLLRDLLNHARIETVVLNEHAHGALGEIPFTHVYPEIWLTDPANESSAQEILKDFQSARLTEPARVCGACGESNPGNFAVCWQCGAILT